jgi:hypothetical protein
MTRFIAIAAVSVAMAGCQTTTPQTAPQIQVVRTTVPPALLQCRDEPAPPKRPATKGQAARYVLDLADAGRDCRSKLGAVRMEVEAQAQ